MGCNNHHVDEATLEKAFIVAWNVLVENKEYFIEKWKRVSLEDDLLLRYQVNRFLNDIDEVGTIERMDIGFMLETLDHIKIFEKGVVRVFFLEGTQIECKNE
ncbi:MAG: hypothetical protein GX355_11050 [Globicatella sulfidifaciens]|uniref:Uncharacterized protein n=2 Tax=Globicatella sulfidifaciens TaxID=136093 RepID=A0A7X8C5I9_9LACT|nr:hypothetical protein [Globicatella sulfidifaciens]